VRAAQVRVDEATRCDATKRCVGTMARDITYARNNGSRGWRCAWMLVFFRGRKRETRKAPVVLLWYYVDNERAPRHNRTYPYLGFRRGTLPADAMLSSSWRKKSLSSISAKRSQAGKKKNCDVLLLHSARAQCGREIRKLLGMVVDSSSRPYLPTSIG